MRRWSPLTLPFPRPPHTHTPSPDYTLARAVTSSTTSLVASHLHGLYMQAVFGDCCKVRPGSGAAPPGLDDPHLPHSQATWDVWNSSSCRGLGTLPSISAFALKLRTALDPLIGGDVVSGGASSSTRRWSVEDEMTRAATRIAVSKRAEVARAVELRQRRASLVRVGRARERMSLCHRRRATDSDVSARPRLTGSPVRLPVQAEGLVLFLAAAVLFLC